MSGYDTVKIGDNLIKYVCYDDEIYDEPRWIILIFTGEWKVSYEWGWHNRFGRYDGAPARIMSDNMLKWVEGCLLSRPQCKKL